MENVNDIATMQMATMVVNRTSSCRSKNAKVNANNDVSNATWNVSRFGSNTLTKIAPKKGTIAN